MKSRSVGLDELVGLTGIDENEDRNDGYWLGGYKKILSAEVEVMFVVAGVALQDLEYFTETLLEDDRFLLLAPTLRVEMERRRVF